MNYFLEWTSPPTSSSILHPVYSTLPLSAPALHRQPTPIPRESTASYSLPPQCCSQYLGIYLTPTCEAWWKCLGNGKENKHALSPGPLVLVCYKYLRVARQFQHQWHGNLSPSSGPLLGHSSPVWEGFSRRAGLKGGCVGRCVRCGRRVRGGKYGGLCMAAVVFLCVLSASLRSIPVSSPFLPSCHLPFQKTSCILHLCCFALWRLYEYVLFKLLKKEIPFSSLRWSVCYVTPPKIDLDFSKVCSSQCCLPVSMHDRLSSYFQSLR